MHIVHTVPSVEVEAAGTTYAAVRLAQHIAALGQDVELYSLGEPVAVRKDAYRDIRFKPQLATLPPLQKLGLSSAMRDALTSSRADIFHAHGLWGLPTIYADKAAHKNTSPLVISPHGMLATEALRFSRLKKRIFGTLWQDHALRRAACFHATASNEYDEIRAYGLTQPVAIIPNGIDVPPSSLTTRREDTIPPFVLSLGRVHPKKGLDRLIHAWALVAPDFPQWRLKIAGPDEIGHESELRRLVSELNLGSVEFLGPAFGEDKIALFTAAELFALSTRNENFGLTVAESLAASTPVISTKGAPWAGLEIHGCGWWIDHGVEPLAAALRAAMSLSPEQRHAMGERGRAWIQRDFVWGGVAQQMLAVYRWLADKGDKPACVHIE